MYGKNSPIGVFDSGMGGVSVLRKLSRVMPGEDFIYFGDSANAPYGTKSKEEIKALTEKAFDYLREKGCKAVVIACNTATSAAAKHLREKHPDYAIIGLEPALKPAVLLPNFAGVMRVSSTPSAVSAETATEQPDVVEPTNICIPQSFNTLYALTLFSASHSSSSNLYSIW